MQLGTRPGHTCVRHTCVEIEKKGRETREKESELGGRKENLRHRRKQVTTFKE